MTAERAIHQDIRPLKVAILNLMPNKMRTEEQFLRLLGNSALQVEITFLTTASYKSKNTPSSYLKAFYQTFDHVKEEHFDALIIQEVLWKPLHSRMLPIGRSWRQSSVGQISMCLPLSLCVGQHRLHSTTTMVSENRAWTTSSQASTATRYVTRIIHWYGGALMTNSGSPPLQAYHAR